MRNKSLTDPDEPYHIVPTRVDPCRTDPAYSISPVPTRRDDLAFGADTDLSTIVPEQVFVVPLEVAAEPQIPFAVAWPTFSDVALLLLVVVGVGVASLHIPFAPELVHSTKSPILAPDQQTSESELAK